MNIHRILLTTALLTTFATVGPAFAAPATDAHQHAAATPTKLMLDHGKKWATDEPLRRNMSEIRAALAAKATAIHHGTLTADDYKALGSLVETHVANIVTTAVTSSTRGGNQSTDSCGKRIMDDCTADL